MKKKRILIFTETFFPIQGGSERVAHNLAVALHENGWDVAVFAPTMPGDDEFDESVPYEVIRDERWGKFRRVDRIAKPMVSRATRLASYIYLSQKLTPMRWDAIIAIHLIPMALPGFFFALSNHGPLILWSHGEEIRTGIRSRAMKAQIRTSLGRARLLFANSTDTKNLLEDCGVPRKRIFLQHPTPDPIFFEPVTKTREEARCLEELVGCENTTVLITFSRLVERKGIDKVLKALGKLHKEEPDLKWIYLIGGTGEDKPRLSQIAHTQDIRERVVFLGARTEEEKRDLVEAADLFVMPNRELSNGETEGFGIVFVEAALRGTPSIGGRSGGTFDAIEECVSGWLVNPTDGKELYTLLGEKIADRQSLESMRSRARQWAEKKFVPHLEHRSVLQVLTKLLGKKKKPGKRLG